MICEVQRASFFEIEFSWLNAVLWNQNETSHSAEQLSDSEGTPVPCFVLVIGRIHFNVVAADPKYDPKEVLISP